MPVMPGINDGEETLAPLFERAKAAGARDVHAAPLFLRPATRAVFFPWLEEEFPGLVALYRRLFARRDYLGDGGEGRAARDLPPPQARAGLPAAPSPAGPERHPARGAGGSSWGLPTGSS